MIVYHSNTCGIFNLLPKGSNVKVNKIIKFKTFIDTKIQLKKYGIKKYMNLYNRNDRIKCFKVFNTKLKNIISLMLQG